MTKMRRLNNTRMQEMAMTTYEAMGEALAPSNGETFEESVENVVSKQIGLGMAMSGNLRALKDSEMISEDAYTKFAAINVTLTKELHAALLAGLGLKEVDKAEFDAANAESSEGQVIH